jgi:hypothetical protein
MRLYLDDDIASGLLVQSLRQAGHDVRTPTESGLAGREDHVHFRRAIQEDRAILSRNYQDFEDLHLLIIDAQGHHPGVLLVRRDNDPRRNMKPADIVRALRNLEKAGVGIADQCLTLNQWR